LNKGLEKIPTDLKNPKEIATLHSYLCEFIVNENDNAIKDKIDKEINIIENLI
jgi:hypothetical protein